MRLRSISPKYLDTKGLLAVRREALLAKNVLLGKTKGYKNHPQLDRFKNSKKPNNQINYYLKTIFEEAKNRGYNFDENKIGPIAKNTKIQVTTGQLKYEFDWLMEKLKNRNIEKYNKNMKEIEKKPIQSNDFFEVINGGIEKREKTIFNGLSKNV